MADLFNLINDIIIREAPIWTLMDIDIDQLTKQEQDWVRDQLHYMKQTGSLACYLANPKGTKYETVWDSKMGWKIKPLCGCHDPAPDFIAEYLEYSPCPEDH